MLISIQFLRDDCVALNHSHHYSAKWFHVPDCDLRNLWYVDILQHLAVLCAYKSVRLSDWTLHCTHWWGSLHLSAAFKVRSMANLSSNDKSVLLYFQLSSSIVYETCQSFILFPYAFCQSKFQQRLVTQVNLVKHYLNVWTSVRFWLIYLQRPC